MEYDRIDILTYITFTSHIIKEVSDDKVVSTNRRRQVKNDIVEDMKLSGEDHDKWKSPRSSWTDSMRETTHEQFTRGEKLTNSDK